MRVRSRLGWMALVAALALAAPAQAADRPVLKAGTLPPGASIEIDGVLSEAAWAGADSITNLVTIEPEEGGVPQGRTVVRVLADPNQIVIGVMCFDADPSGIVSFSKAPDAELDEEDHVLFVFDTFRDERSGYVFAINPGGSRFDGLVTAQGNDVNSDWDAIWEAAATTGPLGWSAELHIPIQSVIFKPGLTEWGLNLERRVQRLQETSRWSGASRDFEIFQTSQAGGLAGLPAFDLGLGLTIQPGYVADQNRPTPGTLRKVENELSLDVRQKLGSNFSAALTVNTDFGETEVDLRQTNLSRFGLFFPEKRAFFLEGADIFEFGAGLDVEDASLLPFFSRRIGIVVPEGEDEDAGIEVPVRAGAKLQGRVGETNLGALVVSTDRFSPLRVPRSNMGAVRIRQNVLEESSVGLIGTFGDPLNRSGRWLGGADATFRTSGFLGDKNLVAGAWGLTTERETAKARAYGGQLAYPNDEFDVNLVYYHVGDHFDPSLGFVQRKGDVMLASVEHNARPGWSWVRQQTYGASYFVTLDHRKRWESYNAVFRPIEWLFESGDRIETAIEPQGERPTETFDVFSSPAQTIEMPAGEYRWTRYTVGGVLAPKRPISGTIAYSFGDFYRGTLRTFETSMTLKPADLLTLQLTAERNRGVLPEGRFTQALYAARAEVKLSAKFQISSVAQYDNESRSFGNASRLRWTFHQAGDLFLAFDTNMARSIIGPRKRWDFESDRLLAKVQYAVRL